MHRKWLPWELNWLRKWGWGTREGDLRAYGEKPVEYITGWASFRGRALKVNEAVLIPRLETEDLVDLVEAELERWEKEKRGQVRVLEVGTGSGAIILALVAERRKWLGERKLVAVASDISAAALAAAEENARLWLGEDKTQWAVNDGGREQLQLGKVQFIQSDLLAEIEPEGAKFELIVANLPYIPEKRRAELDESVVGYEPAGALFGGEDGLAVVRCLLEQAPPKLAPGGVIWLEIDETHAAAKFAPEFPEWEIEEYLDSFGRRRFWRVTRKKPHEGAIF